MLTTGNIHIVNRPRKHLADNNDVRHVGRHAGYTEAVRNVGKNAGYAEADGGQVLTTGNLHVVNRPRKHLADKKVGWNAGYAEAVRY